MQVDFALTQFLRLKEYVLDWFVSIETEWRVPRGYKGRRWDSVKGGLPDVGEGSICR